MTKIKHWFKTGNALLKKAAKTKKKINQGTAILPDAFLKVAILSTMGSIHKALDNLMVVAIASAFGPNA